MRPSIKRLAKDHLSLRKSLPPNYFFEADHDLSPPDDLSQLLICLTGPEGTVFSQGLWRIKLDIPFEYPQRPPTATFITRIFHPNVAEETGAVCLETLKRDWDPKLTLKDILITISCLLIQPNPDSALNPKAGALIQDDFDAYARQARLMTRIHAPIPQNLVRLADAARTRGDSNTPSVLQESQQLSTTQASSSKAVDTPKTLKRSLEAQDPIKAEASERKHKSPKHEHIPDAVTENAANASTSKNDDELPQSAKVPCMPEKIVFRASWASRNPSKARTGIRRL